tara:strand:- start:637 stop:843 length:207 start_codon:yes stop_codon:yes gene_type:complete
MFREGPVGLGTRINYCGEGPREQGFGWNNHKNVNNLDGLSKEEQKTLLMFELELNNKEVEALEGELNG